MTTKKKITFGIIGIIVLVLLGSWFTSLRQQSRFAGDSDFAFSAPAVSKSFEGRFVSEDVMVAQGGGAPEIVERSVIRSGSLSLHVADIDAAVTDITKLSEAVRGFVASTNVYERSRGVKAGSLTVRVPADAFDTLFSDIKALADRVERENISAEDVTDQLVDLEARIANLAASEVQLRALFERSGDVSDILEVQRELTRVRGDIERLEAQQKNLTDQVAFSLITISLSAEPAVEIFGVEWRLGTTIKENVRDMFESLRGYVEGLIGFVIFLPVILLWVVTIGVVLLLARKLWHWIRERFFKKDLDHESEAS